MAYDKYSEERGEMKKVVRRATRDGDVRWGRQSWGNHLENKKMFRKEGGGEVRMEIESERRW